MVLDHMDRKIFGDFSWRDSHSTSLSPLVRERDMSVKVSGPYRRVHSLWVPQICLQRIGSARSNRTQV